MSSVSTGSAPDGFTPMPTVTTRDATLQYMQHSLQRCRARCVHLVDHRLSATRFPFHDCRDDFFRRLTTFRTSITNGIIQVITANKAIPVRLCIARHGQVRTPDEDIRRKQAASQCIDQTHDQIKDIRRLRSGDRDQDRRKRNCKNEQRDKYHEFAQNAQSFDG